MSARIPLPPFPRGWFQVASSDELSAGGPLPLRCFGRDLVLFRTQDGEARVLDAHCPHMGAHLGIGGRVEQDGIRCPFHGWVISGNGRCVRIPYADTIPPKAAIRSWDVRELDGMILVHHTSGDEPPSFEIPALPEARSPAWSPGMNRRWRIRTHVQEALENIVDPAHFVTVHGMSERPRTELEIEGHVIRSRSAVKQKGPGGRVVDGTITWEGHGMGYGTIRFTGIAELLFVNTVTPVDDELIDVRFAFWHPSDGPRRLGEALAAEVSRQLEEDIPIWENKIYRPQPVLCPGEKGIMTFRKWSSQFR
ncbi:(2Fe-2S)-binding protein [Sorangium cellulosum]|uniref:(2Fe-2S)-binding protein n=1 Tax=Sorangium cellulosum TaxID=56 RepID=A0A2L0ENS3_SORCE|nr:Rieske 2Fe-2S domain-containing protein [Sorangium cellulosum]AUX40936.1 (2Fe-2S)-binding protein [Sorangium cellulosum]